MEISPPEQLEEQGSRMVVFTLSNQSKAAILQWLPFSSHRWRYTRKVKLRPKYLSNPGSKVNQEKKTQKILAEVFLKLPFWHCSVNARKVSLCLCWLKDLFFLVMTVMSFTFQLSRCVSFSSYVLLHFKTVGSSFEDITLTVQRLEDEIPPDSFLGNLILGIFTEVYFALHVVWAHCCCLQVKSYPRHCQLAMSCAVMHRM